MTNKTEKQAFEERINKFVKYNNILRVKTAEAEKNIRELMRDLSIIQFKTIRIIAENNLCTMCKIAQQADLTQGCVTQIIDKLIKKKLVKRIRCKLDRRVVYAELTTKGKQIYDAHDEYVRSLARSLFNKMSIEEQESFLHLFEKCIS